MLKKKKKPHHKRIARVMRLVFFIVFLLFVIEINLMRIVIFIIRKWGEKRRKILGLS